MVNHLPSNLLAVAAYLKLCIDQLNHMTHHKLLVNYQCKVKPVDDLNTMDRGCVSLTKNFVDVSQKFVVLITSLSCFTCFTEYQFLSLGGSVPSRPVEDLAFAVVKFFQRDGTSQNYYMIYRLVCISFHCIVANIPLQDECFIPSSHVVPILCVFLAGIMVAPTCTARRMYRLFLQDMTMMLLL